MNHGIARVGKRINPHCWGKNRGADFGKVSARAERENNQEKITSAPSISWALYVFRTLALCILDKFGFLRSSGDFSGVPRESSLQIQKDLHRFTSEGLEAEDPRYA